MLSAGGKSVSARLPKRKKKLFNISSTGKKKFVSNIFFMLYANVSSSLVMMGKFM